jgi:hypothetical protein
MSNTLHGKAAAVIQAWQQNQPKFGNDNENHPGKILLWDQPRHHPEPLKPFQIPQLAKHMMDYIERKTDFCPKNSKEKDYLEEYIELYVRSPNAFPKAERNPYLSIVREAANAVINNSWRSPAPRFFHPL